MSARALATVVLAAAMLALPGAATPASASLAGSAAQTVSGLAYPWEIVPLPSGQMLVTERSARRVRVVETDGSLRSAPAYTDTEAGAYKVLGMALSPDFANNQTVYLYVTHWTSGAGRVNQNASRVIKLTWDGTNLVNPQTIFDQGIWSDGNHDGGRIAFGPDGKLYITTGDVHDKDVPQNLDRLNGKILRINEDGSAPADNPFPGPGLSRFVWSYGHRHPEGIAWDASGRMWETEHGPSRGAGQYTSPNEDTYLSRDEINLIVRGGDYGWPTITGEQTAPGMRSPVVYSGTTQQETWAPGGLAVGSDDRLYVPALYGQHLRSYAIVGDALSDPRVLFKSTFGRLRTAMVSGSSLWLATSNTTGPGVDKLLRIPFEQPASPLAPAPTGTSPGTQPGVGGVANPATPVSRAAALRALDGALAGQARALRRQRASTLAKRRSISLRVSALPAGRAVVGLDVISGRDSRFAASSTFTTAGRPMTVSVRTRASGRRALRRVARAHRRVTLKLTARLRIRDGRLFTSSRRLVVRR